MEAVSIKRLKEVEITGRAHRKLLIKKYLIRHHHHRRHQAVKEKSQVGPFRNISLWKETQK
jgi:hypothetical protein